ncbi:hypothetical protein [Intestinimonas butyriciproducens]|uniref:Uncharacterized protein n=1 Tax=Intestinimonas butyriciproducens TaxID=1297617 RepID=A0A2U1BCT1_9FIRM|nr:hypothetical protein [Intestinimonas butyriciproducens]MCR1906844.1 hypothetical protein [Intestinimonas butyriciproducens]PVY46470.1 hypothetical protein C7373_11518 [Intestinimonas butyriciproducens]
MSKSEKVLELLDGYQYKNTTKGIYAYIDTINGREEVPLSSGIFYSVLADDFRTKYDGASISQKMLMYGKEASNRKQEIDRQHYTIPNQRPKDKHCGKI